MKPFAFTCVAILSAVTAIALPALADPRDAEVPIPPGMHGCCTIKLDDMRGLDGLKPKDRVDVYATFNVKGKAKTVPIAQNAMVLSFDREKGKSNGSVFVTMPAHDAKKLELSRQQGKITVQIAGEQPKQPALEEIPKPKEKVEEHPIARVIDPKTGRVIFTNGSSR